MFNRDPLVLGVNEPFISIPFPVEYTRPHNHEELDPLRKPAEHVEVQDYMTKALDQFCAIYR
jgi:hypothetical protein